MFRQMPAHCLNEERSPMQLALRSVLFILECVSKREIRRFEWIFRQFKEETRRLSSAKSRVDDAEMAEKTPKLWIKEFLRHTLALHKKSSPCQKRGAMIFCLTYLTSIFPQ